MKITPTRRIFIGLFLGVVIGALVARYCPERATLFRPFSQLFLRLIKMVISPLLFASLVAGIAGAGHVRAIGRTGLKAMIYFEIVTTLALGIGLVVVNVIRPGAGVDLPVGTAEVVPPAQSWADMLLHVVPTSIVQAMTENDLLPLVTFSILFGIALGMIGPRGEPVVRLCEAITETMFKLTDMVMLYAPVGVGAAIAHTVGHGGLKILWNLGWLVFALYAALIAFVVLVLVPVALLARIPLPSFIRAVKEPALIAFSTTSSEAALPRAMEALEGLGVPRQTVSFILPLGYSFNLAGTTLYLSLAALFVAQAANIKVPVGQQITMLLTLMLTSKGAAGIPRASMAILAGTLATFGLPLEGVTLILGVDEVMDMGRSAVNVIGNCLATLVIARWEGQTVISEASASEAATSP